MSYFWFRPDLYSNHQNTKGIRKFSLYSTSVISTQSTMTTMNSMKSIPINDLVCMQNFADQYHYRIDLAYARADNLLFGEQIYKSDARLWLHKSLANIVFHAAKDCYETHNARFILYDGLRTIDAQEKMMRTKRARENPHWMEEPRMLSTPGSGGHPRGMAIDIGLETREGNLIDMGTPFDSMVDKAHRDYNHPDCIKKNRAMLDESMIMAANNLKTPLRLLSEEWWDFRLPSELYAEYNPLSDDDLPAHIRLIK